jgi:CDP-4-dehydro-6-deoxyglucose reductase, E1
MKIPLATSGLRHIDIEVAISTLRTNQLTMGKKVQEFEEAMAKYLGVKYFVMVNSGSSANLAIFEALLRPSIGKPTLNVGDGVLVPAVAWPTSIWPLIQLGLSPVFVDVNSDNLAINLDLAQSIVDKDKKIKAVFPIHPLGYAIDQELLNNFCEKNSLLQVNDVCESLGSWRGSTHAGTGGIASTFSFYFSHHITTMEGGGVATNDLNFADDIRAIRSHGWSRDRSDVDTWTKNNSAGLLTQNISKNQSKFQFITTGYNIRPMEIQAAIGIEQLKELDNFVLRRRHIAKSVYHALEASNLQVIDAGTFETRESEQHHSWMLIPIRIRKELTEGSRRLIDEMLEKFEIESRPVLTGNFLNQPAMKKFENFPDASNFPVAQSVSNNYFMVGSHHDLTDDQVKYLCAKLKIIAESL